MTELLPWTSYEHWYELLDAVCLDKGHYDNARLAADLCTVAGSQGQAGFDAAFKNLGNWRRGIHTPHRRNFAYLTKLLEIDGYEGLRPHWNRLYRQAKESNEQGSEIVIRHADVPAAAVDNPALTTVETVNPTEERTSRVRTSLAAAAAVVAVALALAGFQIWDAYAPADPAEGRAVDITVEYRPAVKLMIGESVVIHGMRSPKCGDPAPDWDAVLRRFPLLLQTGRLSDGGVGVRSSASCALPTPVRVVTFTAHRPGIEEINMFGDPIRIEVLLRPPSAKLVDEPSPTPNN